MPIPGMSQTLEVQPEQDRQAFANTEPTFSMEEPDSKWDTDSDWCSKWNMAFGQREGRRQRGLEGLKLGSITEWQAREAGALSLHTWVIATSQEDVDRSSCGRDGMQYGWRRGWGVSERSQAWFPGFRLDHRAKHNAIHQEGKDMGGGRAGTSQEGRSKSFTVAVFSLRFLWDNWRCWVGQLSRQV